MRKVDRAEELASRRAGLEDLAQASAALAKVLERLFSFFVLRVFGFPPSRGFVA